MENFEDKIEKLQHKINLQHKIYKFVLYSTITFISLLIIYIVGNLIGLI